MVCNGWLVTGEGREKFNRTKQPDDEGFPVYGGLPVHRGFLDALLLFAFAKQLEQLDKEIDDIEIERGRGKNVFLRRDFLHYHADIVDDVE